VEGGFIGADYTNVAGATAKYHVGVDWAWRVNNQNKTIGAKVISTTDGTVNEDIIKSGGTSKIGNYIRINCPDGSRIDYFHINSVSSSLIQGIL
jgi:murein DD-endopeptidase MepM/ murein hydrolase activator NlpD